MATPFSAHALEWWLRQQGKFEGARVCTAETKTGSGDFEISLWEVNGVPKPTDEEVHRIIADYRFACADEEQTKAKKRQALLDKLGLTEDEFKELL